MVKELAAEPDSVGNVVGMLRTLSDPTRLRLLDVLQAGEFSVTSLCGRLGLAQPTVSHHLGRLRSAGLVANRRDGKRVFYSLNGAIVSRQDERCSLAIATGRLELNIRRLSVNGEQA